jgi:phosphosulfolactate synthase (CoM biosynthesis protein A)
MNHTGQKRGCQTFFKGGEMLKQTYWEDAVKEYLTYWREYGKPRTIEKKQAEIEVNATKKKARKMKRKVV